MPIAHDNGEMQGNLRKRFVWLAGTALTFFVFVVTLLALAATLDRLRRGEESDFYAALKGYALGFLPWLILSPTIFCVSKAGALKRKSTARVVGEALGLAVACSIVVTLHIYFVSAPARGLTGEELLKRVQVIQWTIDFFIFGLCLLAGRAEGERALKKIAANERSALAVRLLKLEREAATMEARELRHRFSSHFVLNALSNILGLVRTDDAAAAENAILALSDILKSVGRTGGSSLSTLDSELSFLDSYLRFQNIRYPRALFSVDIEGDAGATSVPTFLLQPLVENAFKHGLAPGGHLTANLNVRPIGDRISFTLANSLPEPADTVGQDGEGLALTRARLELSYGGDFQLLRAVEGGQHVVCVDIPRRRSA